LAEQLELTGLSLTHHAPAPTGMWSTVASKAS